MGKKKKKSGSGRKPRSSVSATASSHAGDVDPDLLAEELTALSAIFQDDINIVSETPHTQFTVTLRPYSVDMGAGEFDVSAVLLVRCLPGYPYKCPKLRIVSERGLAKKDVDRLLSLLLDQAAINAREGRVMVFNLVEAAQEFLSEIVPVEQSPEHVHVVGSNRKDQSPYDIPYTGNVSEESFVYGTTDLYHDLCGDDASWGGRGANVEDTNYSKLSRDHTRFVDENRSKNSLLHSAAAKIQSGITDGHFRQSMMPKMSHATKPGLIFRPSSKLNLLEGGGNNSSSLAPSPSGVEFMTDRSENGSEGGLFEVPNLGERTTEVDGQESESTSTEADGQESESTSLASFVSTTSDNDSQSKNRDLLMVYLLHLACSSKSSIAHTLPEISSELYSLGLLSEWARDLAVEPPSTFSKVFNNTFGNHMTSSRISQFWKSDGNIGGNNASSFLPNSRYFNDFEEVRSLGRGGFGHVVLCKNKLDGRQYAVKRIRLKDKSLHVNERILREVATLSRLQHKHVVRYYQAWIETEFGNYHRETTFGSNITESCSVSYMGGSSTNVTGTDDSQEFTYLYIQMEYCPRTLREVFESDNALVDKNYTWLLFRQIVEGLGHIHSQGIIHRDLTPNNIFFDVRNDIKIGDFGLAKFLKLEQVDHDQYFPTETAGLSLDGTGQVGTYFYTAPEIEQKWPQINEKVDMYSLGVVFFEIWHPFATAMERHIVLSDLKLKGLLPPNWVAKYPEQSSLLGRLMSPSPTDRPSATELIQNSLPPRMEDEWLNDILRTIKTSEDTYVYDRVVSTIFDEERLNIKVNRQLGSNTKITTDLSSFKQYTELDTEVRDNTIEIAKEVFKQHGAKRLELSPMRVLDTHPSLSRKTVKLLTGGGNMLELCYELRLPFINWIISNQILSFRRYEISWIYRRAIGHSTPNRFLQGDFDIVGGVAPIPEAEAIKVVMDIATHFFNPEAIHIHLNHGQTLEAIWSWVGIPRELRHNVAELLSLVGSSCPLSTNRKTNWSFIRRQLLQDLNLSEAVVDRLQTADLRFCGSVDQALARLRGALSPDKLTCKALAELSAIFSFLKVWKIDDQICLDVFMPPTESYYMSTFFRMYLKESSTGSILETSLLASGGRYDHLVHQLWDHEYKSSSPGAVGVSLALEKILLHSPLDIRPSSLDQGTSVLVCSKGGGGLLQERMELIADLWQAKIKAEFVPLIEPNLTEQYEYASEHDIKCLVIITEAGLPQTRLLKVRHIELKKEKEVERGMIVKFLIEAISTNFKNLSIFT